MTNSKLPRRALLGTGATLFGGAAVVGAVRNSSDTSNSSASNETDNETTVTNESGTEAEGTEDETNATRILHLSPDTPTVDVYVDGHLEFNNLGPTQKSPYRPHYTTRTYTITVVPDGEDPEAEDTEPLVERDLRIGDGTTTLALTGERCGVTNRPLQLAVLRDEFKDIEEGHARLQAIHASTDAPALDIRTVEGDTLVEDLAYGDSRTVDIQADGEYEITLHETGIEEPLHELTFNIDPDPGTVYSAFIIGYLDPTNAPSAVDEPLPLALATIEDTSPDEQSE